ncbi:TRAP transporter substrate-binding protein DctP [Brevibacterium album]|uniref:TRAP transporter substrate-binding protein DctP n=1 Tax=Brevibacterium album TaxID=417948 RepID=UPI0004052D7E|nr:TRAP transporter substrate-binding protein DctP [Brevibacterium album]
MLVTGCSTGLLNQTAEDGEELRWRIVTHQVPGTSRYDSTIPLFAEKVAEETDGKFVIEHFGGGTLFPITETYDNVATGTVQAAAVFSGYWTNKDPVFNLASIPGDPLQTAEEHYTRSEALEPIFREVYEDSGIEYLGAFDYGPTEIFMSDARIDSLDDFAGLNLRATGVAGLYFDRLGANAVSIAPPELYTALQLGTVDGAEFNDHLVNAEMGLHEVTDYLIEPVLHTGPTSDKDLIINEKAWDSLPASYQQAVLTAQEATRQAGASEYAEANEEAAQIWADAGVETVELPAEDVAEARLIAFEWLGEFAHGSDRSLRYVNEYTKVLRELGYDHEAEAIAAAVEENGGSDR